MNPPSLSDVIDQSKSTQSLTEAFIRAVSFRHTYYQLSKASPIPDAQIQQIVTDAVTHAPSSFNVQSARAVVLFGTEHDKLWDIGDAMLKKVMPEPAYQNLAPKVQGFKAGYGTVLWFEDQAALDTLKSKNPGIQHVIPEWSDHSSGMHQFIVWAALELEGLGCNLQHYNFSPAFSAEVRETWKLPDTWTLKSQLVFGTPTGPHNPRTYLPLEDRVKVFGSGSG